MTHRKPETRWNCRYARQFRAKYQLTRQEEKKREIYRRTIDIANHVTPSNINGCKTCPEVEGIKFKFSTGLSIVYKFTESSIVSLTFYYD